MRPAPDRALLACGLAAPVVFALVVAALGTQRPGYDHARHVLSMLGESGYPLAWAMNLFGFGLLGLLMVLFALGLARVHIGSPDGSPLRTTTGAAFLAIAGLAILAVAALPCDPGCREVSALGRWHSPAASVGAGAMFLALALFGWEFAQRPGWRRHAQLTLALALPALAAGALYMLRVQPYIGLWQRIALAGPLLWMVATAWRLRGAPTGRRDC